MSKSIEQLAQEAGDAFDALPKWKQDLLRLKQRESFAYGNAKIDNPSVTREMVEGARD